MLKMSFEHRHKVLLASFAEALTLEDLARYDEEVRSFVASRTDVVRGILDFSAIGEILVTSDQVAGRGQRPQVNAGRQRVYVAPTPEMYGLCRMFAAYQGFQGFPEASIVRTMPEACALLAIDEPAFESVPS